MKVTLPIPHSQGQQDILDALNKKQFVTLLCGRRYGKSTIAIIWLLSGLLAGEECAFIAPTLDFSREFFDEVLQILPEELIEVNRSYYTIKMPRTGGKLKCFSGDVNSVEQVRGKHYHRVVIDESASIPNLEYVWKSIITFVIGDYSGKVLFCGTPKGKDFFFQLCQRTNDTGYNYWQNFHRTTYDNPLITQQMLEIMKEESGDSYTQEMLAIAGENVDAIVRQEVIERNTITEYSTKQTVIISADIASKKDYTSIIGLDEDGKMTFHKHFQSDWLSIIEALKILPNEVLKVIDCSSAGGGLAFAIMQESRYNWIGFEFTGESKPKLMMELKHALERDKLKFDAIVAKELSVFNVTINQITKRIKFDAMSGQHDDSVDALAMAYKYLEQGKTMVGGNYLSSFSW